MPSARGGGGGHRVCEGHGRVSDMTLRKPVHANHVHICYPTNLIATFVVTSELR